MSPNEMTIEPVLSPSERDEIGHLDYLLGRLVELRDRGLIPAESYATVVAESQARRQAIEHAGRYAAALGKAHTLAKGQPKDALAWAERAREIDPARVEAWKLVTALNWILEEDEEAIGRCGEAAERFPQFQGELERLQGERKKRAEERRRKAERASQERDIEDWLPQARLAMEGRRDAEAISVCRRILAVRPDHIDALVVMAYAQQRIGQLDEALERYKALERLQPSNTTWAQWVRRVQLRRGVERLTGTSPEPAAAQDLGRDPPARSRGGELAEPPPLSWSSFAGEFLQEHWQKLILSLAVLLIVVSSTVGAYLLLRDYLYSPVGKCTLAMVATLLFAAFGAGLMRWGAGRAGRMMLVATLIVVPIHFMLAGEMKLLHKPPPSHVVFLVIEAVVLIGMVRWVSGVLAPPSGARLLTAALLLLSVGSAATSRDSPIAWEFQFASFQLSPLVFLGTVWALGARRWGDSRQEHRDFVYMMLGLLGFALVACLVRTGGYALRLEPALYALPLMLVAISCVHASRRLVPDEPDQGRLALIRLGGFALSGLAFALALAHPPVSSPLYSGNTLAVSLVGLALYVASLRTERHPAFLYLAVGAVVAGRVGAHYFLADRLHAIEEAVRQVLGYSDHLPTPFRAIIGLIPNTALAWLSHWFVKNWDDRRLARHCHYIGVPLSIAACVWSGFEPLAAVICLSGYAILYLLAVGIFAAPRLTYLAAVALTGVCYFGTRLVPGINLADQALVAALLGFVFWAVRVGLRRWQAAPAYHVPWLQAGLAVAAAAMIAATLHLVFLGVGSWTGAGAFLVITALAVLLNREWPRTIWSHVALVSFVEFTICGVGLAMGIQDLRAYHYGLLFMADGLAMLAIAEALRSWLSRSELRTNADQTAGVVDRRWAGTFLAAIPRSAIVLTFVADWLGLLNIDQTWLTGLVFLLGSASLLWLTRLAGRRSLVYLGLAQLVAGTLDLSSCAAGWNDPILLAGWLAVTAALLGLALWSVGVAARRFGLHEFYFEPCLHTAFALSVGAWIVALDAQVLGREAYRLSAAALGLNVLVTMLLARTWRTAELTYAAVFHFVTASYVVILSVGRNDPSMAYVLGLCAVVEAIVLWGIGFVCQRARGVWTNDCARPLFHSALLLTSLAVPLSDRSFVVLALVGVSFLLTVKSLPRAEWLYATVAALGAACYFRWLSQLSRIELIGCLTLAAFGLWALGVLIQRYKPPLCRRLGLSPLSYEFPLFHSSIVAALIGLVIRVDLSVEQSIDWTLHGWFPLALALLSLVMLRAYPRRECVHTSLAFLTWSVVAAIVPSLTPMCFLTLAGLLMALGLLLLERVVRPHVPAFCVRVGVIDAGYGSVVRGWALAMFGLATSLAIFVVVGEMSLTNFGQVPAGLARTSADWWAMTATLGLVGAFLVSMGTDPDTWGALEPEHLVFSLHWLSIAVLWWVRIASSPLAIPVAIAGVYYPLATAVAAVATAQLVGRYAHVESWHELAWLGNLRSEPMGRMLSSQACLLAVLAVVFTKGAIAPATVVTLVLGSLALGLVALSCGWQAAALTGSVAQSAAWGVAGLVVALNMGWTAGPVRATCASAGVLAAAFSLWALAGWLRRDGSFLKRRRAWVFESAQALPVRLAWGVETAAFASSLFAVLAVLMAGMDAAALGGWGTAVGVGVLMGAALLQVLLVPRWQAEWLIYLAQAVMLAAYVDYRMAFSQPIVFDVVVLTLLGYLDLGIAEVLERLELKIYARPARYFSVVLPILPILQLVWNGGLDEVRLFHLFAAATFYAIACAQVRWKSLGYAAAVLYNAALWVLWSRFGWKLSSDPQFFLVPVGLSTILFAEVNRRELGRGTVNTIRTVGLTIIYLSLAVPIWQVQNFGAWVTLLICSLAGILLGIGLRLQTFLWMGLATFVLDVVYEMGRVSLDHAPAKWAIMLALGIMLVLFVALNEKKQIVATMRLYIDQARLWE
ncbi:MAG: tetratricopeptide repeat protein [Isosphaerales bacterium]